MCVPDDFSAFFLSYRGVFAVWCVPLWLGLAHIWAAAAGLAGALCSPR